MAGQPEKILLHRQRERVLAMSRLFAPDPERPDEIAPEARQLPLPEGLATRMSAARELVTFLSSPFSDVRRLAASALGKMAPERPAASMFVPHLVRLACEDTHPQVRQYALKALAHYPREAVFANGDFKDMARDESVPAYVRAAAAEAVAAIQRFTRQQRGPDLDRFFCRRCHRHVSEAEFQASMDRWGRTYCRHCFDEVELESHDFESTVEAAKVRRTTGGTAVQSRGEKRIAEFLERERIAYYYDERYRISGADTIRPDFYLPEFDIYIEYYGMDTPEYNANRRRKHILYQRAAKKLISVSFRDDANLIATLKEKLARYISFSTTGLTRCACSGPSQGSPSSPPPSSFPSSTLSSSPSSTLSSTLSSPPSSPPSSTLSSPPSSPLSSSPSSTLSSPSSSTFSSPPSSPPSSTLSSSPSSTLSSPPSSTPSSTLSSSPSSTLSSTNLSSGNLSSTNLSSEKQSPSSGCCFSARNERSE